MKPSSAVSPPHICTPNCFRIYRDGKWLPTRECKRKLQQDDIRHNREQRAKKRIYGGGA